MTFDQANAAGGGCFDLYQMKPTLPAILINYVGDLNALSIERRPPGIREGASSRDAQDIYCEAFNHAYAAHRGESRQEEAAHRIAWAAVKRSYVKVGAQWVVRPRNSP
jgi:cation transport regulator